MKTLVVVDMQNDFVTDALRNEEGIKIVPDVVAKVKEATENGDRIIFTRDTHYEDYMETEEGKNLPVQHCIYNTKGWQIIDELLPYTENATIINKLTFGSTELGLFLNRIEKDEEIEEVTLIGLCTDICVISNALLIKAFLPNVHVKVDSKCCAGVTPESHENALNAMKSCHIEVV